MAKRSKVLKISSVWVLFTVTATLYGFHAQNEEAEKENPQFDFSIYYAGNVRGNLEPCG